MSSRDSLAAFAGVAFWVAVAGLFSACESHILCDCSGFQYVLTLPSDVPEEVLSASAEPPCTVSSMNHRQVGVNVNAQGGKSTEVGSCTVQISLSYSAMVETTVTYGWVPGCCSGLTAAGVDSSAFEYVDGGAGRD